MFGCMPTGGFVVEVVVHFRGLCSHAEVTMRTFRDLGMRMRRGKRSGTMLVASRVRDFQVAAM